MPWEKSFDEEATLDRAMQVFWEKGFESTSITDLIEGTGINRGSLYNAYGGKQPLFVRALLKYDRDKRGALLARLEALDNPKQAICEFFDGLVTEAQADKEKKGCFLINTASELYAHDQEVHDIISSGLREVEAFFRRSIEVGQARGDIPKDLDAENTAKTLLGSLVAIRVLGRGVFTEPALQILANEAKQSISKSG